MRIIRAIFVLFLLAAMAVSLVGCNLRKSGSRDNGAADAGATATIPSDSGGEKTGGDSDGKDNDFVQYSYDDWAICGILPWVNSSEEIEKRFGKTQWVAADGSDDPDRSFTWWSTQANYNFGYAGFGANTDGAGKNMFVHVFENSESISLPRGIGIGASIDALFKSYVLESTNENGYYYGDETTFPSVKYEDESYLENGVTYKTDRQILILQAEKEDIKDVQTNWICEIRYFIERNKVTSILFTARASD